MRPYRILAATALVATISAALATAVLAAEQPLANAAAGSPSATLGINDVSFLWPLPQTAADAAALISASEQGLSGAGELLPKELFQQLLAAAEGPEQQIESSGGSPLGIRIPREIADLSAWKVAGIRIDPSSPGCSPRLIQAVGSTPQIRLILQPVVVNGDQAQPDDFAMHLVFDFVERGLAKGSNGLVPAIPDRAAFKRVVDDLVELKKRLAAAGVVADGSLGVHPGFLDANADLTGQLRSFLKKHLKPERINNVAMMGVRRPEPWIFFIMRRTEDGFRVLELSSVGGARAQMLFGLDPEQVLPPATNSTFGKGLGVSTTQLLQGVDLDAAATDQPVPGVAQIPSQRDVPDIIANPAISNVLNTNCVSCHTETTMRIERGLQDHKSVFAFQRPDGFTGLKPNVVPSDRWNVRNFGWGVVFGTAEATVAVRTANEAAESAKMINEEYLSGSAPRQDPPPSSPVAPPAMSRRTDEANPLTLVLKAKSEQDLAELKKLITGIQGAPPEQNPIVRALDGIGLVHYARFVFLDDKLLIITTYDGSFDAYVDLFVDEIGDVFNAILKHVDGWEGGRVQDDRDGFLRFVTDRDLKSIGEFYRAYPNLNVEVIKSLQKKGTRPRRRKAGFSRR